MDRKTLIARSWKAAILVIGGIMVVLGARTMLRSERMRQLVLEKLRVVVMKAGGPGYHLDIGRVDIDPIGGDLAIADISLTPDTSLFDSLRQNHVRLLLSVQAGRISVNGLSYWRLLLNDEVRVAKVTVLQPVVRYFYAAHRDAQAPTVARDTAPEGAVELVSITELVITGASGAAIDLGERAPDLQVGRLDVRARDLRIRLPEGHRTADWEVRSAHAEIHEVRADLPPHYDLSIDHIGLLHPEGIVRIDSLRYVPKVERNTTHEHLREMTTMYGLDVRTITLASVDLYRAFAEQQVEMGSLTVDGALFDVFLDKSMPDAPSHFMPLPVSALRNVPFGLRVDTLRLTHADMVYSERFEVENGWGSMRLTGIDATILNVSNDTSLAMADTVMRGTVDAKLFDKGALHGVYMAPLASRNDAFTLDVTMSDLPLAAANSMSENLILLRADSGWINSLRLHMRANNDSAVGAFTLRYSNAWLRIVNGDGDRRGFLTGLVNTAMHHDSKDKPVAERTEQLRIARRKDRSLFNFIWICTREGLTHTLLPEVLADVHGGMMKRQARAQKSAQRRERKSR